MLALQNLSHMALLAMLFHSSARAAYVERDDNSSSLTKAPTTTDFPAPESTDANSQIRKAYTNYITICGQSLQSSLQAAITEYQNQFGSPPTDPTSPSFVAWARGETGLSYASAYGACIYMENLYQKMLASFVPDTPASTSSASTTISAASSTSTPSGSGGSGSKSQGGGASSCSPGFLVLVSAIAASVSHVLIW
ncbi:hypothetical protein C8R47DRAFT_1121321 [Mycena vitilis]|nr:hypothetical protein C8R47DRAFT_1121321 [Mycena vitilis]